MLIPLVVAVVHDMADDLEGITAGGQDRYADITQLPIIVLVASCLNEWYDHHGLAPGFATDDFHGFAHVEDRIIRDLL